MKKSVTGFGHGLHHVLRGLSYLNQNRSLIKWTIAPFLIGLVIVVSSLSMGAGLVSGCDCVISLA